MPEDDTLSDRIDKDLAAAPSMTGISNDDWAVLRKAADALEHPSLAARLTSVLGTPHSPLKYRVIGPYRNIDAFHEAFGTAEGDAMWLQPEERVRIW